MAPLSLYTSFYSSLVKSVLSLLLARLYTPQRPPARDLSGQIAIVTGANSGIGLSIATSLARQGATVYLACRNPQRGHAAVELVTSKVGGKSSECVHCWELDTSDQASVHAFCEKWKKEGRKIDMLVHNAGIGGPPAGAAPTSRDGLELVYATNFLGSFLMTHLLEQSLSNDARVVFTSSTGSYSGISILADTDTQITAGAALYGHSKALQVLFAQALQRHFDRARDNERTTHAFSPGFTSTPIFGKFDFSFHTWYSNPIFAILKLTEKYVAVNTDEGAKTGAWLASSGHALQGGRYWEQMICRTSVVDFLRGTMGEAKFWAAIDKQWKKWERDAKVNWETDF